MSGISHKQAQNFMRADLDGLLTEAQHHDLEGHLNECEACRVEAESLSILTARLRSNFQERWSTQDGPSENVLANIHSKTGMIVMSNRIRFGLRTLAGIGALVVLGFLINFAFAQLRNTSTSAIETKNTTPEPTQTSSYDGLIAFVSGQENGNEEIFTMHADGSGLTNITNNLATDTSPAWSPDGTRIAFGSDRSGDRDIYVMDADGSNLAKLTALSGFEGFFSWSPDGQKIVYTTIDNYNDQHLIIMNADGSNKTTLTNEPGSYRFLSWSLDGQKIVYQKQKLDSDMGVQDTGTYITDIDGSNQHKLSTILDTEEIQWQDSQHFLGVSFEMNSEEQPIWSIYRFATDGSLPLKLASYNTPIVALFEKTYVVDGRNDLLWYSSEDAPTPLSSPLSSWSFAEICKTPGDQYLQDTSHFISPDKKYSFVSAYCRDGNGIVFYLLMNEDGTEIRQLGMPITNPNSLSGDVSWAPDGKYVTVLIDRMKGDQYVGADLYLFDIEKMLNDPSVKPIQLTVDRAMKYGAVWQPQP